MPIHLDVHLNIKLFDVLPHFVAGDIDVLEIIGSNAVRNQDLRTFCCFLAPVLYRVLISPVLRKSSILIYVPESIRGGTKAHVVPSRVLICDDDSRQIQYFRADGHYANLLILALNSAW